MSERAVAQSHEGLRRTGGGASSLGGVIGGADGVVGGIDGVVEIVLVVRRFATLGLDVLEIAEESRRVGLHVLDGVADVLLLVDAEFDQVGCVVDAPGVSIDQGIEPVGAMQAVARVRQLVLQFLEAVAGERNEQLDSIGRGVRIADLFGFGVAQVILLLRMRQ